MSKVVFIAAQNLKPKKSLVSIYGRHPLGRECQILILPKQTKPNGDEKAFVLSSHFASESTARKSKANLPRLPKATFVCGTVYNFYPSLRGCPSQLFYFGGETTVGSTHHGMCAFDYSAMFTCYFSLVVARRG